MSVITQEWHDSWKQEQIIRRKEELIKFYQGYFKDTRETEEFINIVYHKTTIENNNQLRMMNNIIRFSTMMDDVQDRTEVKLFILMIGIESLYKLTNNINLDDNKRLIIKDFLENYLSENDKEVLQKGIKHSIADEKYFIVGGKILSIDDLVDLFSELRNRLAHEGIYGYFSFSPRDGDSTINVINLYEGNELKKAREEIKRIKKEQKIDIKVDDYKNLDQYQRTYEVTISFDSLKRILIKGMVNYLKTKL